MLKGSGSEKMDRWGLKRLSTYGILADFTQPELTQLLDAVAAAGLVECTDVDRFRPTINLTPAGWEVVRDQSQSPIVLPLADGLAAKVRNGGLMRLAPRPASSLPTTAEPPETIANPEATADPSPLESDPLWERLRVLRLEWAREAGQPAYIVFPNRTLEDLVRTRPRTPQALAAVKGLGPAKLERYGAALLEAIAEHPLPSHQSSVISHQPAALSTPAPSPAQHSALSTQHSGYVPTEEWTWRLLERGFSPDEIAAIRGLDRAAIVRHATWMARQGQPVAPEAFLPADLIGRWDAWLAERGDASPPNGAGDSAPLWALFLACRRH